MSQPAFTLVPISTADAGALRQRGGPVYVADEFPGYPCRQCLRDAAVGEELILVSHDPFTGDSEYRGAGPIFLHRHECSPELVPGQLPTQLTGRLLSARAFDDQEMMIDAAVIDGTELDATIATFFENASVDHIHVHNATRGCWAVAVTRP